MIQYGDLNSYEQVNGLGHFDVWFKHRDDKKTIWGESKMRYENTTLRSLAYNIYDCLYSQYEIWVRETPKMENGQTEMSDKNLRYAISLEADNMFEDMAPLDCHIVNGWLVMSALYDTTFEEQKKFFVEFGLNEPFKLGPSHSDMDLLEEEQIEKLTDEQIKKFTIRRVRNDKLQCSHCQIDLKRLEKVYEMIDLNLDEKYDDLLRLEENISKGNQYVTKEGIHALREYKKVLLEYMEKRDEASLKILESEDVIEYICNICNKIFCDKMIFFKRICADCRSDIEYDVANKKKD